jgi:hypothetical protein
MSRAAGSNGWALGGALTGHVLLGFVWLVVYFGAVFLTSSYTGWADLVFLLGGFCWLVALPIMVIGWRSGSHWYWGVPVAWVTVFAIAAVVVVAESVKSSELRPVGATATFGESADCLVRYGKNLAGLGEWRLNNDNVADCFPMQTAAKKRALIACFNTYERNHTDHKGWPEDNMEGCTWAGLTTAPAPHVVSVTFGKVVAVPDPPRAGKRFDLTVAVKRTDSAEKVANTGFDDTTPFLGFAITMDGEDIDNLVDEVIDPPFSGRLHVRFTVPRMAEGKRLAITLTIAADSPTATKVVTFTVSP